MSPRSANRTLIDPAQPGRFGADLARVLPEGLGIGEPLALAVSGGPDSMAMLLIAQAAMPGRVVAATVDHGLRAEAASEAALVAHACARLGVPHATLTPEQPIGRGNVQARARAARYGLLGRWAIGTGARVLATAHHADDQAETFLMRAVRGSGLAGLAGARPRRELAVPADGAAAHPLTIVRPLLGWRRDELAAIVAGAGQAVAADPSNGDDRYDRTRIRQLLRERPELDAAGLARAAACLADTEADLRATLDWLWRTRTVAPVGVEEPERQVWLDMTDLPRELRRRLARAAVRDVRRLNDLLPPFDLAANVEPLLDRVDQGRAATQADILVTPRGPIWRFAVAPPRRAA